MSRLIRQDFIFPNDFVDHKIIAQLKYCPADYKVICSGDDVKVRNYKTKTKIKNIYVHEKLDGITLSYQKMTLDIPALTPIPKIRFLPALRQYHVESNTQVIFSEYDKDEEHEYNTLKAFIKEFGSFCKVRKINEKKV